ncbi:MULTISPECIES: hypothetical protein [Geodermatophilus]|uniref:Uncharacterized protein n=1 Tax=Geodermatophilus nigrescens TaxID=1070870 RepID=A0A1M5ITV4_9ACTN|nr:hypothetical protein [Geodermatophilus nigrescens]SHG31203.1 hypothetical protein SAMN05444351_2198 [Geodermatophilus nigrescens]
MFDGTGFAPDWFALLGREVLRERRAALIAEACAWTVGLSDRPHHTRLRGRLVATGSTIGDRAATGQALSGEEDGRIELGDARPGSFQDALNAVDADGTVFADRFDREVIEPFVLDTCVAAADRARRTRPAQWADLLDDLGEDPADADPADVVRAGEWEQPLRTEAEHLVLAALGRTPLLEVEAEGLPLSLVRAAEATARAAVRAAAPEPEEDLSAALFLALAAVRESGLPSPVPPGEAPRLTGVLLEQGLEPAEVTGVLPHLPLAPGTADRVRDLL